MKLFTLNTHGLSDTADDNNMRLQELAYFVARELPDIIALQEVSQTRTANPLNHGKISEKSIVRQDNFAHCLLEILCTFGVKYNCVWEAFKIGYDIYDEGCAVMSRKEISDTKSFYLSDHRDYSSWKTRKAIGLKNEDGWFYSIHTSRDEKSFLNQLNRLNKEIADNPKVWIMGDFNIDANENPRGYDAIVKSGWYDSFVFAKYKKREYTVKGEIDGWENSRGNRRIDYIFSNYPTKIKSCETVFDGENGHEISDHFGVMTETGSD